MERATLSRQGRPSPGGRGFTLLELLIVVSLIAVIVAIATPKVGRAIRKANEGASKGKLGSIRMALQLYYADSEGIYPADLTPLLNPGSKYLTEVVPLYTYDHGNSTVITYTVAVDSEDTGGWGYVNSGQAWGQVWVQCTHLDAQGNTWNQY